MYSEYFDSSSTGNELFKKFSYEMKNSKLQELKNNKQIKHLIKKKKGDKMIIGIKNFFFIFI